MICFLGGGISKALRGDVVGGAEKQTALIAKEIKKRGLNVIVLEYHLLATTEIDGIMFYPAWKNDQVNFINKIKSIYKICKAHDVRKIYCRGTDLYVAALSILLKIRKIQVQIFWGIAGDHDLSTKFNYLRTQYANNLYEKFNLGLMFNISSIALFFFSDVIICQTNEQVERCNVIYKKKRIALIPNIFSLKEYRSTNPVKESLWDAIWVGKFTGNKGENVLLRLAQDIPHMKIVCLGHVSDSFKKTPTFKKIKSQKNLILIGRVQHNDVNKFICKSNFVLNTSPSEGFSNVFLEGWNQSKPVISYKVDPNCHLSLGKAGYCANGSYLNFIEKIESVLKNKEFMKLHGENGKRIVESNHLAEKVVPRYLQLFK